MEEELKFLSELIETGEQEAYYYSKEMEKSEYVKERLHYSEMWEKVNTQIYLLRNIKRVVEESSLN